MRKFKFRFWHKDTKKWIEDMGLDENGKIVDLGECFHNDGGENGEYYIAQQYTGIKSKDGQEIYEGDIVQAYASWDDRTFYGHVVYSQQLASFVFISEGDEYYMTSYPLEIVGNIFENPELLKKNMKLYAIEHDTRDNGCGILNGELFKTFKEAVAKIEQFTHVKHGTSFDFGSMGWIDRDEYGDEDNTIIIYEKEVDV